MLKTRVEIIKNLRSMLLRFLSLFIFSSKILLIKSAGVELGAATATVGAHRLERADELGALRLDLAHDLFHYCACLCCCLHTEAAASHKHKLLRVYVHHMRNGRVLGRLRSVVVVLAVVSLALHKMRYTDEMTAEMNRNVIGNVHFNAEVECADRAMFGE